MKTLIPMLILLSLVSCGGGGDSSSTSTESGVPSGKSPVERPVGSGSPTHSDLRVRMKAEKIEHIWKDLAGEKSGAWVALSTNPQDIVRMGAELALKAADWDRFIGQKEILLIGKSFLAAKKDKRDPNFTEIALKIIKERNL